MNNGTFNKNFQVTKSKINTNDNKNLNTNKDKIDDFEIKVKSPLMYNRNNHPKYKNTLKGGYVEEKIKKINAIEPSTAVKQTSETNLIKKINSPSQNIGYEISLKTDKVIENTSAIKVNHFNDTSEIEKKVTFLEKEIKLLKIKISEQDKVIKDKNSKLVESENESEKIKSENMKLKEKIRKLETRINTNHRQIINPGFDDINPFDNIEINPQENARQIRIGRMMEIFNNMNQIFHAPQDDDYMIDEIYPNPDNMTYEQLLELQDKMGYVSKGISSDQIKKIPEITFRNNSSLSSNIGSECTICQYEFNDGEKLKKLNCNHTYHTNCAEEWFINNKCCPICKDEIKV